MRRVVSGALNGLIAWLIYAAVEFALTCAIPVVFSADRVFSPWGWPLLAVLLSAYAAVGIVLGAVAAALLNAAGRWSEQRAQTAGSLTIVIAFIVNLLAAWPPARSEAIALGVAILLGGALAIALLSDSWALRMGFFSNPWAVSLLLLTAPWISRDELQNPSAAVKTLAALAGLMAIVAAVALLNRTGPGKPREIRRLATVSIALTILCGAVWIASDRGFSMPQLHTPPPGGKPNVLLITMDTVRADHLSVYGYPRDTTPGLKKFAGEATVYTRAIAAADMTLASHASIFTGMYPSWHHAHYDPPQYPYGRPLGPNIPTLAQALSDRGYITAGIAANYVFLSSETRLDRGFQIYRVPRPVALANWERPFYLREGIRNLLRQAGCRTEFESETRTAEEINHDAVSFLRRVDRQRPFFLFSELYGCARPLSSASTMEYSFPRPGSGL